MESPVEVQWELKDDSILLRAIFNGDMNTPVVNIPFSQCLKITEENWGYELPRVTVGGALEYLKVIEELKAANNLLTERCEELSEKLENFESNLAQSSAFTAQDKEAFAVQDSKNGILSRLTELENWKRECEE